MRRRKKTELVIEGEDLIYRTHLQNGRGMTALLVL